MKKQPQETNDDRMLGKVIALQLRQQLGGTESDCPETETVAAFYDRTLSGAERAMWENHFLKCLRCQEYLAELARLADADEPPSMLGESAEEATDEPSPGWFYRLAWAIPFVIIGVSSAVWYREDIQRFLQQHEETAMNTAEPSIPADQPSPGTEAQPQGKPARAAKDLAPTAPGQAAGSAKSKKESASTASSGVMAQASGQAGGGMAVPSRRMELSDAAKVSEAKARMDVAEKRSKSAEVVAAPAAAPPAPQNAPAEADAAARDQNFSKLGGLTISGAQRKIATQWRVGRRGTIQKPDDSGGWTRIVSGVDDDLFDITFAGTTGWVVGHEGTVLRSPDGGSTWQRVAAPTSEDLVHVSSQGAQQAQVISRSGKIFTTTDGGQSWK